jgi:hypothetical protein
MRHRRQDRLRGVTPPSHGGNQKADLNHLGIHTTTARGACCREAVIGSVRLVDFQASPKSISHQPKHNSRLCDVDHRTTGCNDVFCLWADIQQAEYIIATSGISLEPDASRAHGTGCALSPQGIHQYEHQ